MKNRILMFAMAAIAAIGMISCGNPAEPEVKTDNLTIDNVDEYVVSLGEYKGLTVSIDEETVTDDMLDYYTDYFFSIEAQNITGYAAKEGDTVVMDYVGRIDGATFNGGSANDASLVLGSHNFIDGFEDGLIGVAAGEKRDLNLVFPENYYEEYAGKAVVFEVTVKYVIPAFSDEAVALLHSDSYSTASEYQYFVEQAITEYVREDNNNAVVNAVLDRVIAETQFKDFPASFIDQQKQIVVNQFLETAASYGLDVATYLEYCGTSVETLTDLFAKQQVVFYVICNREGLYPSEQDIADNAALFAEYYGYDSADAYFAETSKEEFINTLIGSNVFEYLLGVTNVSDSE